ncbi:MULTISPECIES: SDR family NAD(P)-dependent oxidoreductase [unclassified Paraburkholderia]|uniref:SDR family NAD(P)-dependent oxidoreductase n=1 Tax=unclassified Paraburkholderia TaxID=2615204 RepID=UPI0016095DBB|nr:MULTISPECIES: SDR family NAD(P)-dependent oxidoreductase [unclassified Paraburkholderia]
MSLNDKVIVITGAFGQLGRAVTAEVLCQKARAALLDIAEEDAPNRAHFWRVDLASLADTQIAMGAIAAEFGRIDGLVNVAGGFTWQTLESSSDLAAWHRMYEINAMTCVTASMAALPYLLKDGGRIVNVGAAAAVRGATGMGPYAAAKSAVARFTESLSDEIKHRNVAVNAVLPSIIDTPQNRADMPNADFSAWVTPQDVAQAIAFLLSDAARSITGALLPVTGRI